MTLPDDPWRGLAKPTSQNEIIARRVSAAGKWNFFWAIDHEGRRLLVLRHAPNVSPGGKLPAFKGFDVARGASVETEATLTFRLLDVQQREPFHRLCLDIVDAAESRSTEQEAIAVALQRTWRWHYMLRGGAGRLGAEEQKGLLAELLTLRDVVALREGLHHAIDAWVGPLGAVHDFRLSHASIECKAGRGSSEAYVAISSEHQLEPPASGPLYLRILMIQQCEPEAAGATTLADVIEGIAHDCENVGQATAELFVSRLQAAGALGDQDLTETSWRVEEILTARVEDPMPRLVPRSLPLGVAGVRYGLSVAAVRPHTIGDDAIWGSIQQMRAP